jgi:hypothetical protein
LVSSATTDGENGTSSGSNNRSSVVLSEASLTADLKLLQPGDSYAFAFMFTEFADLTGKSPGFPQVKWCTSMGEFSLYRGDYTYCLEPQSSGVPPVGGSSNNQQLSNTKSLRYECLTVPCDLYVGEETEVVVRIYNTTSKAMSAHLDLKHSAVTISAPSAAAGAASASAASSLQTRGNNNSNNHHHHAQDGSSTLRPRLLSANASALANAAAQAMKLSEYGNPVHASAVLAHSHRGLCFSGLTFTPLGVIESMDFVDITVRVHATSAGLHDLPTLFVIDSIGNEQHAIHAACRILVHEGELEEEEEEKEEEQVGGVQAGGSSSQRGGGVAAGKSGGAGAGAGASASLLKSSLVPSSSTSAPAPTPTPLAPVVEAAATAVADVPSPYGVGAGVEFPDSPSNAMGAVARDQNSDSSIFDESPPDYTNLPTKPPVPSDEEIALEDDIATLSLTLTDAKIAELEEQERMEAEAATEDSQALGSAFNPQVTAEINEVQIDMV